MTAVEVLPNLEPQSSFRQKVESLSGESISACFQCMKCTNGCPLASYMDITPHKLMREIQFGLKDEVLKSRTIWICASCETCSTRCPNGIQIAHVMDTLRQIGYEENIEAAQRSVPLLHKAFLGSIKKRGRVYEGEMILAYTFKNESWAGLFKLVNFGLTMFKKGKVKIIPSGVKAKSDIKQLYKASELKG